MIPPATSIQWSIRLVEARIRQDQRAASTAKGRATVEKMLRKRWRVQKRLVLANNTLRDLPIREAVSPEISQLILRALFPGAIQASLQGLVTETDVEMFAGVLGVAFRAGAKDLAKELEMALSRVFLGNAEADWIRRHGFEKLASDIDRTTRERLKNHIGEIYQSGGTYADMVRGIREMFDGFTDKRADLIARTELNAAYNHGGLEFAKGVNGKTKSWNPLGSRVCPICLGNQAQGDIPIDGAFQSGDEAPGAHPNCSCVLDFGFI